MYVPQGMIVTETYPNFHPEYIMAMKFLGSPDVETQEDSKNIEIHLKLKTRLARRLTNGEIKLFY